MIHFKISLPAEQRFRTDKTLISKRGWFGAPSGAMLNDKVFYFKNLPRPLFSKEGRDCTWYLKGKPSCLAPPFKKERLLVIGYGLW